MTVTEQIEVVQKIVEDFIQENSDCNLIPIHISLNPESLIHVINIGTSILCTKWGVGYAGGSFVQAVVDNNLTNSFAKADDINRQCLYFYVNLMYNTSKPNIFLEEISI